MASVSFKPRMRRSDMLAGMFLGLRTVIYPAPDLDAAKAWFTEVLGREPYFDQPFYVGFEVGGYELGLSPDAALADGATTYWGVPDVDAAMAALQARGATDHTPVTEVGEGIRVAAVRAPGGSVLGIIENPHFAIADPPPEVGSGPGR
jgi:catechol 2,3-dioxygenase-like lactoylglutathione lyase family enzyme